MGPRIAVVTTVVLATAAGCSSAPPPAASSSGRSPGISAAAPSPAAASPAPPQAADPLAGCPPASDLGRLPLVARIAGDVDDVAADPAGNLWLSIHADGRLVELDPQGAVLRSVADPHGPEGVVVLGDGSLVVAEQLTNDIVLIDPATGARRVLATVPGPAGQDVGIDGIADDRARGRLLVPDSPLGTLLAIPEDGGGATVLARGLGRPVSAAALADGSVLVGVENAPGLVRVALDGTTGPAVAPGALRSVDEVVVLGPIAYITDLDLFIAGAVDPASRRLRVLVSGSPSPQGLATRPDGRLVLVDAARHLLVTVGACR